MSEPYKGTVYLLHFLRPLSHAQHYIGWTSSEDPSERLGAHSKGRGSRMCAAAGEFELVRTWKDADRNFERYLKNRREAPRFCPLCSAARKEGGGILRPEVAYGRRKTQATSYPRHGD